MKQLKFKELTPGLKIIMYGLLDEGFPEGIAFTDTVMTSSKGHIGILRIRFKHYGSIPFNDIECYLDNKKTRTYFLLESISVEEFI